MRAPSGPVGSFLAAEASAGMQFSAGAALMAAFLFQQDLAVRGIELVLFLVLDRLCGRRVRVFLTLATIAAIVLFNLLVPAGKVVLSVAGFSVTLGALRGGVAKATAFSGMLALSRLSIRPDLRLPGRFGGLLARALLYFERIMSLRSRIDRRNLVGSVDAVLLEVYANAGVGPRQTRAVRTSPAGAIALAGAVSLAWVPLLISLATGRALLLEW